MLDIFRGLKGLVKPHATTIDSSIFRLHYSASVTFLLAFSLIVTTRKLISSSSSSVLQILGWFRSLSHSLQTVPSFAIFYWFRPFISPSFPFSTFPNLILPPSNHFYLQPFFSNCFNVKPLFPLFFHNSSALSHKSYFFPTSHRKLPY